jgi:cobalamin biosynthesis protein CbiG
VNLVLGVGFVRSATADDVRTALGIALDEAGAAWTEVTQIATIDTRRGHPALTRLDRPVRFLTACDLAGVSVPSPSTAVLQAIGIASVAEAAALAASGASTLLIPKRCTPRVCTAVARPTQPR